MSTKYSMVAFRIRLADGAYSSGGQRPVGRFKGKLWATRGHVASHITGVTKDWKYLGRREPHPYVGACVVRVELLDREEDALTDDLLHVEADPRFHQAREHLQSLGLSLGEVRALDDQWPKVAAGEEMTSSRDVGAKVLHALSGLGFVKAYMVYDGEESFNFTADDIDDGKLYSPDTGREYVKWKKFSWSAWRGVVHEP